MPVTLLLLLAVAPGHGQSVTTTWLTDIPDPGNISWGTAANWDNGAVPAGGPATAPTTAVVFDFSNNTTSAHSGDRRVHGITFTGASNFTVNAGGGVIYAGPGGIVANGGNQTFNAQIRPTESLSVLNNGGGTLQLNQNFMVHTASPGDVTLTFGGTGDIVVNNLRRRTDQMQVDWIKTGAGTLTIQNPGISAFDGGNGGPINPNISLFGGTVAVNNQASLGYDLPAFDPAGLLIDGGALRATGSFTMNFANRGITLGGSGGGFDSPAGVELRIDQGITGPGALTKTGAGNLLLTAANTYAGGTVLTAGDLQVGNNGALGSGPLTVQGGQITPRLFNRSLSNNLILEADLVMGGGGGGNQLTLSGSVDLTGGSRTVFVPTPGAGAPQLTLSGVISNGALVKDGPGVLLLNNNSSYSGGTTLVAGELQAGQNNALGSGPLTIQGGVLTPRFGARNLPNNVILEADLVMGVQGGGSAFTLSGSVDLTGGSRTVFVPTPGAGSPQLTLSGVISNGALVKDGPGSLLLSNNNLHGAGTTVLAGELQLGAANALGSGPLTVQNATITPRFASRTVSNPLILTGDLTMGSAGNNQLAFTGGVDLAGGTRSIFVPTPGAAAPQLSIDGTITNGTGLIKTGPGELRLRGSSDYSGETVIQQGTLFLGGGGAPSASRQLPVGTVVTVASGATLRINGLAGSGTNNEIIGGLQGGGTVTTSNGATIARLTIDTNGDHDFSGGLNANQFLHLNVQGNGTQTFSGDSTFAGNTTVESGTWNITGNVDRGGAANPIVVLSDGTLSGSGSITSHININGGTLAPGDATLMGLGTMTLNGNLDFASSWQVSIDGTQASLLQHSGNSLDLSGITLAPGQLNNPLLGNAYLIYSGSQPTSGQFDNLVQSTAFDLSYPFGTPDGYVFLDDQPYAVFLNADFASQTFNGNDIVLFAVPEPGRATLLALAVGCLLLRRRRCGG